MKCHNVERYLCKTSVNHPMYEVLFKSYNTLFIRHYKKVCCIKYFNISFSPSRYGTDLTILKVFMVLLIGIHSLFIAEYANNAHSEVVLKSMGMSIYAVFVTIQNFLFELISFFCPHAK